MKKGKNSPSLAKLELEVDEALEVCGHELADDEDCDKADYSHQNKRHLGKPDPVTSLEIVRKPMDQHADKEHQDDGPVLPCHLGHQRPVPASTNLVHHILRRTPCLLIGLCRIKVGPTAEEESSEGYEYESHQHGP